MGVGLARDSVLSTSLVSSATVRGAAPVGCIVTFIVLSLYLVFRQAYPGCYDELQHVSYAAFLQETGRWLPKFGEQRLLLKEDMGGWDSDVNYLGHPSPFYLYIGAFLDRTLRPARAILAPRVASDALIAAGVIMALLAGRRYFARDWLATVVFCCLVALCPQLLAVSAQVSNDSLGFLGGALAYWGALRRSEASAGQYGRPAIAAALGLAFALWSKPNAGLLVGCWLATFIALTQARPRGAGDSLVMASGLALGSMPYWLIVREYGAVVPIAAEQFGPFAHADSFASYAAAFVVDIGYTFGFAHVGLWPLASLPGRLMAGLFWLLMAGAAVGAVLGTAEARRRGWTCTEAAAVAAIFAFAVVLPIHYCFAATALGFSLTAASFRYYLPLWPALAHAFAYAVGATRCMWLRSVLTAIGAAPVVVGWIWR